MVTIIEQLHYNEGKTRLFSLGQAGFIVKSQSCQTLGIDLYLSNCVEALEGHSGYHRLMPQIVSPESLVLDYLIATHFHRDHFDVEAVPGLMSNGHTMLFCAYDCSEDAKRLKLDYKRVCYVKPGDTFIKGDFKLTFIKCDHGKGAPLAVGVIIDVDGKRILEVGDTCLRLDWMNEYLQLGPIDVLIAPINGAYGNMNERENVRFTKAINPRLAVPCHFGMFASHGGQPGLWKEIIDQKLPKQDFKLFTEGESIVI